MTGKQLLIETVQRGADSRRLSQDIVAVGILLQHGLDAANLPFYSLQTVKQLLLFFLFPQGLLPYRVFVKCC